MGVTGVEGRGVRGLRRCYPTPHRGRRRRTSVRPDGPAAPPNLYLEPQTDADRRAGAVEVEVVQVEVVVHVLLLRELVAAFRRDREVVADRDAQAGGGRPAE